MKMRQKARVYYILMLALMLPGIGYALITEQNTTTSTSTQMQAIGQPGTTCQFPPCPPTGGQAVTALPGTLAPTLAAVSGNVPVTTAITPPAAVSGTTGPAVPGVALPSGAPISAQSVTSASQTTKVEETKVTHTTGEVVTEEENVVPMANPVTYREMRELMIYESNLIHGECACPYSPDRIGGQCGSESKYYKPHSDKLYCYLSDISNTDVHFFWLKHGIGLPDY